MASEGIAVGCTTCEVALFLEVVEEDEVRVRLAQFFAAHDGCEVFLDVSRTEAALPQAPTRRSGPG